MTENKRFEWDSALGKVYDYDKPVEDTFESYREWELVDLLNEQDKTIKQLQEEIKDFQDILANKEEELLKPIIRMIDDRIAHYKHEPIGVPISNPVNPKYDADVDRLARLSELQQLKKELKGDDEND